MTGKNQWLILTFDKIYEVQFLIVYLYNNNRVRVEIGESSDVGGNSLCVYIPTSYSSIPGRSFQCNAAMKIYGKYVILNTENCFDFWLSEIKIYGEGKDQTTSYIEINYFSNLQLVDGNYDALLQTFLRKKTFDKVNSYL